MKHVARWAVLPLTEEAHLLERNGDHPPGVLKAQCGEHLPTTVVAHDRPPDGRVCFPCTLIARASLDYRPVEEGSG